MQPSEQECEETVSGETSRPGENGHRMPRRKRRNHDFRTTVTIREEPPPLPRPFIFPKSPFPSPLQIFWERHRLDEPDPLARERMDAIMEKYV